MILLRRQGPAGPSVVALFGTGRVGSAVLEGLGNSRTTVLPFTWTKPAGWDVEGDAIAAAVPAGARAAVVWSAGDCGFSASEETARAEMGAFEAVLRVARRLADRGDRVDFHLLSSAGGLFEGRTGVRAGDAPAPRRPYGRLKLAEEARALAEPSLRVRVYRVASVYGPLRPGHRLGLVCTLVGNTAGDRVTTIFGDLETRRDFVFSRDVGAFVARRVAEPGAEEIVLLASGRATSIREAIAVVGRVLGREPRIEIRPGGDNASPISFSPDALPAGFRPLDLEAGVREVWEDRLGSVAP